MRRGLHLAAAILLAGACAACTVGPDFQPPSPQTPADYADRSRAPAAGEPQVSATTPSDPDPQWWRSFHDPQLDSLIDRAATGNLDLQQAVYRILAARLQVQGARAAGLPDVRATGSYTRQQLGLKGMLESHGIYDQLNQLGPETASQARGALDQLTQPVNLYQVGFDASWELDLFGRVRRSTEAAAAQAQAAEESRNDALVSLEAEVAQTYAQLRGTQAMVALARDEIRIDGETLELVRSRQRSGLASDSQVQGAEAQLAELQAQLPQMEQRITQALNGLALLVGAPPGTLDAELSNPAPVPTVPEAIPVGLPASLARRRPDVRKAEAQLHAATANIGASIAQMFPDVSLTGQFGLRSTEANYLTNWASHFYSFGPQISLPIFQGGALRAQVRIARAEQGAAVLAYRQAVLQALHDVDNALAVYRSDQHRRFAIERAADANRRAFELASNGYRHGLATFIEVLDAQRQSSESRLQQAQADLQVTTDLVALYKALGGGWQPDTAPPPAAPR